MDEAQLGAIDNAGYVVVDAITHVRGPTQGSSQTPHLFVCTDGRGYWVKAGAQEGLLAELIAGRLAAVVQAGPHARVIRVPPEALPSDGSASQLEGLVVGIENEEGTINARELGTVGVSALPPSSVRADLRARVVVFQSWIGVSDQQVLLDLRNGRILSIDHGACFGATDNHVDPTLVVTSIPGVPDDHGHDAEHVAAAVDRVESVSDDDLLRSVAQVPLGAVWRSDSKRRLQIARWLAYRRDKVREVVTGW